MQIAPAAVKKPWTVMVWSASDNDLYVEQVQDLDRMERVGSTDQAHMVAQIDLRPSGRDVRRYELQADSRPGLRSPIKERFKNLDMANPKNLSDFVRWAMKNYPAEHYWLVVADHGDAWKGACEDAGGQNWMSLPSLRNALAEVRAETGRKLDLLSFDCCLMSSAEVAHEMQSEARFMSGSPEEIGTDGLPHEKIHKAHWKSPEDLARRLVGWASGNPEDIPAWASWDLEKMPQFSSALKGLAEAIVASPLPGAQLRECFEGAQKYTAYRDLYHAAERLAATGDPALQAASRRVMAAQKEVLLGEWHSKTYPNAHGVNIEHRADTVMGRRTWSDGSLRPAARELDAYTDTMFARDTGWDKVLERLKV